MEAKPSGRRARRGAAAGLAPNTCLDACPDVSANLSPDARSAEPRAQVLSQRSKASVA